MRTFPTLAEILILHDWLIDAFGGTKGVRDQAALESAIARPQSGYYDDAIGEAAALLESLSQNHPFLDGNKRVAIAAVLAFLRVNGYTTQIDEVEAYNFLIGLYESGRFRFSEIEPWLRGHAMLKRSSLR